MPPRRRAVMLLRYGWGLEPKQVCALVSGLSARAYRKEVTRGVDELAEKLRSFERGEWCEDRLPLLKAHAAGLADADTERQARAHLSHCNECSRFVARLSGRLHDLGTAFALPAAIEALGADLSLPDRVAALAERARDAVASLAGRDPAAADSRLCRPGRCGCAPGQAEPAARQARRARRGAKIAGACVGGIALSACVATFLVPSISPGRAVREAAASATRGCRLRSGPLPVASRTPPADRGPSRSRSPAEPTQPPSAFARSAKPKRPRRAGPCDVPAVGAQEGPAPAPPPVVDREFGVASAAPPATSPRLRGRRQLEPAAATVREEFAP